MTLVTVAERGKGEPVATRPAPAPGGVRLRRRPHQVVLTAHILTSVGWFGVAAVVAFCPLVAAASPDPTRRLALYRTVRSLPWMTIPLGLAAFASGAALSLTTAHGLIRHWWVVAKIVIATAVVVTDALLVIPVATRAAATGHAPVPLYGASIAHVVVLAVATGLSVFKPRRRTPWGQRLLDTKKESHATHP